MNMRDLSNLFGLGQTILLVGAVLLYVASRAGVEALAGSHSAPGRRAFGHWLPIVAAALVAVVMNRADLAMAIIFATSVGCLSLLIGSICLVGPASEDNKAYRRFWAFALPAALLALLAGFAGQVSWRHAILFLVEGAILYSVWREIAGGESVSVASIDIPAADLPAAETKEADSFCKLNFALCLLLAIVGAIAAMLGTLKIGRNLSALPDSTSVVGILAPLLVLPMLTSGATLAQRDRAWAAVTSGVGVVLLNICLLFPVVVLLWYPRQAIQFTSLHQIHFSFDLWRNATPLPFGWLTWRVDSVVLVLLSFLLIPVSMGRWRLGRAEGFTLVLIYVVYVLLEAAGSLRS
jgi:Ca2+/Na+ antiporter